MRGLSPLIKKKSVMHGNVNRGALYVVVILALTITGGAVMTGGMEVDPNPEGSQQVEVISPSVEVAKSSLQMDTFYGKVVTPTPIVTLTPTPVIPSSAKKLCALDDDNGVAVSPDCQCIDQVLNCKDGKGYNDDGTPSTISEFCGTPFAPGNGRYCVGKPVIYLYPQSPTFVDVRVKSIGKVVISDPLYPQDGWKHVLAYPSGQLLYQGKNYQELFYESEVSQLDQPTTGVIIPAADLASQLTRITTIVGLNKSEQQEFLSYWLPTLSRLHSPYFLFSIVDPNEKERIDHLDIAPTPDTFIGFLAYFKPLSVPYTNLPPLKLSPTPQRHGFTVVEWGGVIGK
jgi:hypothetical protein